MKNKCAEIIGLMIRSKEAENYFKDGWNALYEDIMKDPIKAMKESETNDLFNTVCGMGLYGWYSREDY